MELKCFRTKKASVSACLFQSYLYGIEMSACCGSYRDAHRFQSYLYGIEIIFNQKFLQLCVVSIVPLWNWNALFILYDIIFKEFQSYLYGIEIMNTCLQRGDYFQVSIVPLWNWNWRIASMLSEICWFQSYLYGIEIEFQLLRFDTPQQFQSYLYGIEIYIGL